MKTGTRPPRYALHQTDLGWIGGVQSEHGLAYLTLPASDPSHVLEELERPRGGTAVEDPAALAPVFDQIDRYLAGEVRAFDAPLDLVGTPFQIGVWRALLEIPWGATVS